MKPSSFEYVAPRSLDEAIHRLTSYAGAAKVLAGGQSLVPLMNLRLASPEVLIDINGLDELGGLRAWDGGLSVGALVRQSTLERADLVRQRLPLLAEASALVGHPANRHRGTVGGSLAHADPAADYPAAIIALGAEMVAEGPKGKRSIKADDFFKGLLTTALAEDEILTEVRVPALAAKTGAAYMKFPHPASRFAVVGVAAVLSVDGGKVGKASVGITGAGTKAVRAKGVEAAITGKGTDAASIQAAAEKAAEGVDVQADLQGSVEYKSHLLRVFAKRAMEAAAAAVK